MTVYQLVDRLWATRPRVSLEEFAVLCKLAKVIMRQACPPFHTQMALGTIPIPPHLAEIFSESCAIGQPTEDAEAFMIMNALATGS